MSAYIIFTREKTINKEELALYAQEVGPSFTGHPVKNLAVYGPQVILEGPEVEGVVIAEFPTKEDALAWYNSPAYQKAAKHRFNGAVYRAVLVEGVPAL